jgi:integrase/recombinase XerD
MGHGARPHDTGGRHAGCAGALSASRLTRDYLEAAGIAKRGACHLLRHTMATGMLEHGADVRVIQEILGHARLTTTQLYTRVSIRLLKAVHTATHPAATLARPTAPPAADTTTSQLEESASLLAAKEETTPPTT